MAPALLPTVASPYAGVASDTIKGAAIHDIDKRLTAVEAAIDVPTSFTLADAVAKTIRTIAVADLSSKGGFIEYLVKVTDGTDVQSIKGRLQWAAVSKATAVTAVLQSASQIMAASAGTCAVSFSTVLTANQLVIQITVDSSLVPTAESVDIFFEDLA